MPNHYHLVAGTPRGNLSQAMGWLQVTYTVRFNQRHGRSGHLFQGRFKAQLVEADEYGRWLVEYVHLNPVRPRKKGMTIPPEKAAALDGYEWSSHRDYAGLRKKPADWLRLDWLGYWGVDEREGRRGYRKRMGEWFGREVSSPWERLERGLVLGGGELMGRVAEMLDGKKGAEEWRWTREQKVGLVREKLRELLEAEEDERLGIWARIRLGGERGVDVGRERGQRNGSGVGHLVKRLERESERDKKLKAKMNRLRDEIPKLSRNES
jgi:hypothetical protein